jgi:hypothetical protein
MDKSLGLKARKGGKGRKVKGNKGKRMVKTQISFSLSFFPSNKGFKF